MPDNMNTPATFAEVHNPAPAVFMDDDKFIADLTTRKTSYCSMAAETAEDKAKLFAAMNNPEKRLGDCINQTIYAKDLYCEVVDCMNRETGEVNSAPRIVIIDKDGIGYQAVSLGVYGAIKKLISVFGAPTWETPIPLTVKQITRGTNKMLTFDVGFKK